MKRWAGIAVAAWLLIGGGTVLAAQGDWLVRARVININPDASSSALNLNVDTQNTLELDFSHFVGKNLALELILATKKHGVTASGTPTGSVKHLPPTLTLQYHFAPEAAVRPYLGAGINYTRFYDINLGGGTLTVDRSSWGGAVQAGLDIALNKSLFLNFDIKKVWIETDVKTVATGATAAHLKINPVILGVGIGMKF